jgi:hypothetical protein
MIMRISNLLTLASSLSVFLTLSTQIQATEIVYTIPAGENLAQPVDMKFEDARLLQVGSKTKLEFRLPSLLNGPDGKLFSLEGTLKNDSVALKSKDGEAECVLSPLVTNCEIKFRNLKLDHVAAEKFAIETQGVELSADIKKLREAFEHQAVGIITIVDTIEVPNQQD